MKRQAGPMAAILAAVLLSTAGAWGQQVKGMNSVPTDGNRKLLTTTSTPSPTAAPTPLQDQCNVQICFAIDEKLSFTSSQYTKMNILLDQLQDAILDESTSGPTTPTGPDVVGAKNPDYFPRKLGIADCKSYLQSADASKPKAIVFITDGVTTPEGNTAKSAADAARAASIDVVVLAVKKTSSQTDASLGPLAPIASGGAVFITLLGGSTAPQLQALSARVVATACPKGPDFVCAEALRIPFASNSASGNGKALFTCPGFPGVFCSPAYFNSYVGFSGCGDVGYTFCNSNVNGQGLVETDSNLVAGPGPDGSCNTSADCPAGYMCNHGSPGSPGYYCARFVLPACVPS